MPGLQPAHHRFDARRLVTRRPADIDVVHGFADPPQHFVVIESETRRYHLERHLACSVSECRPVEIEPDHRLRRLRLWRQPDKASVTIDEAADQPRACQPVDPGAPPRCPGPPLVGGRVEPVEVRGCLAGRLARRPARFAFDPQPFECGGHLLAAAVAEEVDAAQCIEPLLQPAQRTAAAAFAIRSQCAPAASQVGGKCPVLGSPVEQSRELRLLTGVARTEADHVGVATGFSHRVGEVGEHARALWSVRQQIDTVTQGPAAARLQRTPGTHPHSTGRSREARYEL